jgi:leucyl aminopeptidase
MRITVTHGDVTQASTPALIINLFEGITHPGGATGAIDLALDGAISQLISEGETKGKKGEMTLVHTFGRVAPSRVLVAGLGKEVNFNVDAIREVTAEACRFLRRRGITSANTIAHGAGIGGISPSESAHAIAEGASLGLYRFTEYKSRDDDSRNELEELSIIENAASKLDELRQGAQQGTDMAEGVSLTRDMVNAPPNVMTPTRMAEIAMQMAAVEGLECTVLERHDMQELGMGSFLGVAQGSVEPPKLITLQYRGDPDNPGNNLGLLGKGITFDSGGLSLKTAQGMEDMKRDMAGGASVMGAMKILSRLQPKINVTGIIGATENMPGGEAQRPGDIVRTMGGKTIEVLNTDAEGRLVLADVMCYAKHLGVKRMVDIATLTGAVVVALGNRVTGVMGNDQPMVDRVLQAGKRMGEPSWQLPLHDYKDMIRSNVADMKNTGGRGAGSITAACILAEFAEGVAWAHMDVAGTTYTDREKGYMVKGATGVPVRTLVELSTSLAEEA